MHQIKECRHEILAHGPAAAVLRCKECNVVSVHLGSTTVRVDARVLHAVWATLGDALIAIGESPRGPGDTDLRLSQLRPGAA